MIFYPDPADFTSAEDPLVYPDSWWLPPTAAVSGSLFTGDGDPLTPGYPALSKSYECLFGLVSVQYQNFLPESAYRMKEESLETLPKIPTHTIGYGDAQQLLKYGQSILKFRVTSRKCLFVSNKYHMHLLSNFYH